MDIHSTDVDKAAVSMPIDQLGFNTIQEETDMGGFDPRHAPVGGTPEKSITLGSRGAKDEKAGYSGKAR